MIIQMVIDHAGARAIHSSELEHVAVSRGEKLSWLRTTLGANLDHGKHTSC